MKRLVNLSDMLQLYNRYNQVPIMRSISPYLLCLASICKHHMRVYQGLTRLINQELKVDISFQVNLGKDPVAQT